MSKLVPITPELLAATVDGLILSGPLVPPTLEGRKTVTRRMSRKWLKRRKGDLLFLRENWSLTSWTAGSSGSGDFAVECRIQYRADGAERLCHAAGTAEKKRSWFEREHARTKAWWAKHGRESAPLRPSLLLPRWASRCVIRLTEDPRLEHVQEITEKDAEREGVPPSERFGFRHAPHLFGFIYVWSKLHTKPGERFEDNPVVVRIAFERIA